MKTLKLLASSEAVRRRRTAFAITGIEIGLLILKNETSFMSNSMRIVSPSGSARVLPEAHFEVDFFSGSRAPIRQKGRQPSRIRIGRQRQWTGTRQRDRATRAKNKRVLMYTRFLNTKTRHPLTREGQWISTFVAKVSSQSRRRILRQMFRDLAHHCFASRKRSGSCSRKVIRKLIGGSDAQGNEAGEAKEKEPNR